MPSNEKRYPPGPEKKDGKQGPDVELRRTKMTAGKYTIKRTPSDIKKLDELRKFLQTNHHFPGSRVSWDYKTYNTDSEIYRDIPDLFLLAVKTLQQLEHQVDELTAKLDELEDLRSSICRVIEIAKGEKDAKN